MTTFITDQALIGLARARFGDQVNIPEFIRTFRENAALSAAQREYANERETAMDALQSALAHAGQWLAHTRDEAYAFSVAMCEPIRQAYLNAINQRATIYYDGVGGAGDTPEFYAQTIAVSRAMYDRAVEPIMASHDARLTDIYAAYERTVADAHRVYEERMAHARNRRDARVRAALADAHERGEHEACTAANCKVVRDREIDTDIAARVPQQRSETVDE